MTLARVIAFFGCCFAADAQQLTSFPTAEGDYTAHDFRFASGEVLPSLRLHYTTLGEPRRDAGGHVTNAVLILHGTGGSGQQFLGAGFAGELYGPGQPLDIRRFYIILPDGIGHGKSSKPSDGAHARFPHYTYGDMVRAQHELVQQGLLVDRLRLVMGTSMGGMQTWQWGEQYPAEVDALMPLASATVPIAGRNRIFRKMLMDSIRLDPEWHNGEYTAQPRGLVSALYVLYMMTSSPLQAHKAAPTAAEADRFIDDYVRTRLRTTDANDLLYQFDSSRDYDPSAGLEKIRAPLFAVNSADDEVNPPELGILERDIQRVPHGQYVLIPTGPLTRGHGTHTVAAVWKQYLAELLARTGPDAN